MRGDAPKGVEDRERAFFDEYYADEACHPVGLELRMRREVKSLLKARGDRPLDRVLSIGCGDGIFELMLAPHAGEVLGIDLAAPGIERAKQRANAAGATNLDFRCMPVSQLEWGDHFDAIVCLAFLHHLPEEELPEFLTTVHEHVRPGGFFYSQDPNANGLMRKLGRMLLGPRYDRYHSPDERELDPEAVATAVRAAGFRDVQLGCIDFSLIPLQYFWPKAPSALMHVARGIDALWCATPLSAWSSGFKLAASRSSR